MSKSRFPKRFDMKAARDGRECPIDEWGVFTIGLVDESLPRYYKAKEMIDRKAASLTADNDQDQADMQHLIDAEVFVRAALLNWSAVPDWRPEAKDGDLREFSPEAAIEYFTFVEIDEETGEKSFPTRWILERLTAFSRDIKFFQPIEQKAPPEKN